MVFKKDLTPIGGKRGVVKKIDGKGSAERRPDVMARITNRYPKQAPVAPTSAPMGPSMGPPMGPPMGSPMGSPPGMLPPEEA